MAKPGMDDKHDTKQIVLIHLSDPHFGPKHRFNPERTPAGDIPVRKGYPTLLQKMLKDLDQPEPGCPVLICITGDFAESGDIEEFNEALEFVKGLADAQVFNKKRGLADIFIVPGNHDVLFDKSTPETRLANFAWFQNALYNSGMSADPETWTLVHNAYEKSGTVVVTLNSAMYVAKGKPDQDRGHIDVAQLSRLENALEQIDQKRLQKAIKIALIHHHPVLIPSLAEPGRGYDAVHNSGRLLSILRKYGFHMVLHGHKHDPYVFTEDSRSAFRQSSSNPLLVAAGGSVGSVELPHNRWNTYNRISIKWHPAAGQARILIETVGLSVYDSDGNEALPANWHWRVVRRDDLHFLKGDCIPHVSQGITHISQTAEQWRTSDHRFTEYSRLRGNMLCVEVRPSLHPRQGYEAVLWLAPHKNRELPAKVEWSAGEKFEVVVVVKAAQDSRLCATFDYWGPMLVQARLIFEDERVEEAFIYARIPEDCGKV